MHRILVHANLEDGEGMITCSLLPSEREQSGIYFLVRRFIRTSEDDAVGSWEQRLAKKYYDKLFKE